MEDYKKKYEDALEKVRKLFEKGREEGLTIVHYDREFEAIFPELKEDEDERIREWLIDLLSTMQYHHCDEEMEMGKKALAWLEKQGENKPNYCHHEVDLSGCSEEYRKAYYDGWNNCNQQHSQLRAEQKPADCSEEDELSCFENALFTAFSYAWQAYVLGENVNIKQWAKEHSKELSEIALAEQKQEWSEEDEKISHAIIRYLYSSDALSVDLQSAICWIKDVKDRCAPQPHWKPSEQNILLLERLANGKSNPQDFQASLGGLIGELKKLKEE